MGIVWTKVITPVLPTIQITWGAKKRKLHPHPQLDVAPRRKRMKFGRRKRKVCTSPPQPNSYWSSLPEELLGLIFQRVGVSDNVRLGAVCRQWNRVIAEKRHSPAMEEPWVWVTKRWADGFYSPSEERWYRNLQLPRYLMEWRCYGSQHGWLIFARQNPEGNMPHFVNPFSGVQIQLRRILSIRFLVPCMSSDKFYCSHPPDNPQCIVVYINSFGVMGICNPKSFWVTCNRPNRCVSYASAIFYKGSLYAATSKGELCLVDLANRGVNGRPKVWTLLTPPREHMWDNEYLAPPIEHIGDKCSIILIEHQEELLMCCEMYATATFEVFKANVELLQWEQAGDLEADKLFISDYWANFMPMPKPIIPVKVKRFVENDGIKPLYHCVRPYQQILFSPRLR